MNLLNDHDFINVLTKIWAEHDNQFTKHKYLFPDTIDEGAIIFLSLNPSISNKNKNQYWYPQPAHDSDIHPHYRKFIEIYHRLGRIDIPWSAMDLLYLKESGQNQLRPFITSEFILQQAKLTLKLINKLSPKLVVVSNAMVNEILHLHHKKIGFYPYFNYENRIYSSNGIPFIIRESKFLGSRQHWYKNIKIDHEKGKIQKLIKEMVRVLEITEHRFGARNLPGLSAL